MVMIIIYIHVLIETWNLRLKAKFGKTQAISNATTSANNTTTNKNDNNSKWCWTGIHTCSFMRNYVLFILKAKWVTILEKLAFSNRRGQLECDFSFLHSARLVLIFQSNADRLTMSPCPQPQLQQKVRRYLVSLSDGCFLQPGTLGWIFSPFIYRGILWLWVETVRHVHSVV